MKHNRYPYLAILLLLIGFISLGFIINFAGKKTALTGRAQASSIQPQCSPQGKVQFAISFTNPETVPIDLLADVLLQTRTISRSYISLAPGKTQTDIINTSLTSLSNTGDVAFTWYPVTDPSASNNTTASFDAISCESSSVLSPQPTLSPKVTNQTDSTILALTPLPPQPPTQPKPFYQPLLDAAGTKVQTLIYNFFRFLGAFRG